MFPSLWEENTQLDNLERSIAVMDGEEEEEEADSEKKMEDSRTEEKS